MNQTLANGNRADELDTNLPALPCNLEGEALIGKATPLVDLSGAIYAVEVRRLASTGYDNIAIGMHALIDPNVGFEATLQAVDRAVQQQLKTLGGADIQDMDTKRSHLRSDIMRLEIEKEDLRETLLKGKVIYDQAESTVKAVGASMPPHRFPTWTEGQPVETDQAYLLRNGWSFAAAAEPSPYYLAGEGTYYTERDAVEKQRDLELVARAPEPSEVASTA